MFIPMFNFINKRMRNALYASLLAMLFFSACQDSGESEQLQEKGYTVSILARIGKPSPKARYEQIDGNANAEFAKGDDIGVFIDNDNAVCWKFDGTAWSTSNSIFWKDADKPHTFCAYYPFSASEAENKESIKMPSLESQNGSWENIAQYDFLVASKSLSYKEDHGNVSFTNNHSFKHISSLLKINIKAEGDMAEAVIDKVALEGSGLMTQTYYSFATGNIAIDNTNPKESFVITPKHSMDNHDVSFYFILNGTKADENNSAKAVTGNPISLTIEYTSNDKSYTAQREGLSSGLSSGCIHEYNILVKGGSVFITGGSITGWTPGNEIEDIIINGEEIHS